MSRWLVISLALLVAFAALYLLVERPAGEPPPLDDIDDASRDLLERVISEAEREEEPGR